MNTFVKLFLISIVALGLSSCGDNSTAMSKQVDEWWEIYSADFLSSAEYKAYLEKEKIDASDEKGIFLTKIQFLNNKIAFYSCGQFDKEQAFDNFEKCSIEALDIRYKLERFCKNSLKDVDKNDFLSNKQYQQCMIENRENLASTARKLALYKYDSEFDKKQIKDKDLEVFVNAFEEEVSSEMNALSSDSQMGKLNKEEAKVVAQKLITKASEMALQDYINDSKHKPFNALLETHSFSLQEASKKSATKCIQSKCGGEMPKELLGLMMSAAFPYALGGAFSSGEERKEAEKLMTAAAMGVLKNHPWGKCMINNETKCQIQSIEEYKIESSVKNAK